MTGLLRLVEIAVWGLTVWNLLFLATVALELPTRVVEVVASVVVGGTVLVAFRSRARGTVLAAAPVRILGVGLATSVLLLFASRPDADDATYLRALLLETADGDTPFAQRPFALPVQGVRVEVPGLGHYYAYETLVVSLARFARVDPVQLYHNQFPLLAVLLFVSVYGLLFRQFGVPRVRLWMCVLASVAFLFLDGNTHRSFGNFSLIRIWQGKVVAWTVLVPAFLLFGLRCTLRPTAYRIAVALATAFSATCLNRSSVVAFPILAIAISVGALTRGQSRLSRTAPALVAAMPFAALAVYILAAVWPVGVPAVTVFRSPSPVLGPLQGHFLLDQRGWWAALETFVFGNEWVPFRDLAFLTVPPLLALPRRAGRCLVAIGGGVALLAFSPLTAPVWFSTLPTVFWRLYFVLPLAICAGLTPLLLTARIRRRVRGAVAVALALLALLTVSLERPVLSSANGVLVKPLLEYRLEPDALAFTRAAESQLKGHRVLATFRVAIVLSVLLPDVLPESPRNGGVVELALANCRQLPAKDLAAVASFVSHHGVELIVLPRCPPVRFAELDAALVSRGYRLVDIDVPLTDTDFRLFGVARHAP